VLGEQEVIYLSDIYKKKIEKWREQKVLDETYQQAAYTAKFLTKDMIEGQTPICFIIARQ